MRNGMCLLTLKINRVNRNKYQDAQGELDIMIDAAKQNFFKTACLQTRYGRMPMPIKINAVSWHGFYFSRNGDIQLPVINFKRELGKKVKPSKIQIRHSGTVNQENIFAFPICSLYVPKYIPLAKKGFELSSQDQMVELQPNSNARIDFFILPEGISANSFIENYSISIFYFVADITIFNKAMNGSFEFIPVAPQSRDFQFETLTIGNHDVIVRTIYTDYTREFELNGTYSILVHDPNDTIDMILNRYIAYEDSELLSMRERHEHEVNIMEEGD